MSASGSCRTSCARSLCEIRNRNFTSIPRTRHARSPQRVALRNPKTQCRPHSAHSTRTISAEGCASKSKNTISPAFRALDTHDLRRRLRFETKNAISPAFRALDTHDLRRGLHFEIKKSNFTCILRLDTHDLRRGLQFEIKKHNFTCIPRTRHARSPQKLHFEIKKRNFTCIPRTRHARSPQRAHISKPCFRSTVPATKSWAEVIRNAALATQMHPPAPVPKMQPLSGIEPFDLKMYTPWCGSLRLPRKTQSFEWHTPANVLATSTKYCACHDFHNVSDSLHLPKLTFLTSTSDGFLEPAMRNDVHVGKRARTPGKTTPSKLRKSGRPLCASLRGRNQHRISKRHSCADETTRSERAPGLAPGLYSYRKNPSV